MMPLLTMENRLNARAEYLFTYLFNRFAINDDPDNPDGNKVMGDKETIAFAKYLIGSDAVDGAYRTLMNWDSNGDGKLTLKDILLFYEDACQNRINVVRENLSRMGFRADL